MSHAVVSLEASQARSSSNGGAQGEQQTGVGFVLRVLLTRSSWNRRENVQNGEALIGGSLNPLQEEKVTRCVM